MAGREEYVAHTWNSYPCPRDHPYTWSREFLQRIRAVLESAADIAGRISADLCLGMYSCPVALIEITDTLSGRCVHSADAFCCYSTELDRWSVINVMKRYVRITIL